MDGTQAAARGHTHRRLKAALALALVVLAAGMARAADVQTAHADGCTTVGLTVTCTYTAAGQFVVPEGITEVTITAIAAPGSNGNNGRLGGTLFDCSTSTGGTGGAGGRGASVTGVIAVLGGDTLAITVAAAPNAARGGGIGGAGAYGPIPGFCTLLQAPLGGSGGDGGGASFVTKAGVALAIAGGGGGGGGGGACTCSPGADGGVAGGNGGGTVLAVLGGSAGSELSGTGASGFQATDNAIESRYAVGGGGGGGGGLLGGGGGGGGTTDGGGGGGGGTSLVPVGGSWDYAPRTTAPAVTIVYTLPDTTQPVTTIAFSPGAPNGLNGYYTGAVHVTVSATDTDSSGVQQTRCSVNPAPAPETFTDLPSGACAYGGSGVDVSGSGVFTIYAASKDNAGNVESPLKVATFNIDTSPPAITAAATTSPNVNGWYNDDIVVHFHCTDNDSGVPDGACPPDQTLSAEGSAVSSTAMTVTDAAGNVSAPSNVITVKIDRTAPADTPAPSGTLGNADWYLSDVSVAWNWTDAPSGVDGGNCTQANQSAGEGSAVLVPSSCQDLAGNSASDSQSFKIDKTPPTISAAPNTPPNGNGWHNGDVVVQFDCSDAHSGIAATACPLDQSFAGEGSFSSTAEVVTDIAGNTSSPSNVVTGMIDKTAPSDAPVPSGTLGNNGWYVSDVSVAWNWTDGLSGVDTSNCTQASSSAGEGAAVLVSSSCQDLAGNSSPDSLSFKVDKTGPTVACPAPPSFIVGSGGNEVTATVTDGGSGPVAGTVSAAVSASSVGGYSVSLTGEDNAGNTTTVQCQYVVGYDFGDFLAPLPKSTLKVGSKLPVRFTLLTANGQPISDSEALSLVGPQCKISVHLVLGGTMSGCPTYDASSDQFQFNVKLTNAMKGANGVWITVTIGTTVVTTSPVEGFTVR